MPRRTTVVLLVLLSQFPLWAETQVVLYYSHPNDRDSIAGRQVLVFAEEVWRLSDGELSIQVLPESATGGLSEQIKQVSSGVISLHHNTAGALSTVFSDFGVLDTPFLYEDVNHLMRVVSPDSPVMEALNQHLAEVGDVLVLYSFFFGSRVLTADRPIYRPEDLADLRIRSIPFPVYEAAVQGMGAEAVPVDWSQTIGALRSGFVNGQENPLNTIRENELYLYQSHVMITNHIHGAELVLINKTVWNNLTDNQRAVLTRAGEIASEFATNSVLEAQEQDLLALENHGMTAIRSEDGLDLEAFRISVQERIRDEFGTQWAEYFDIIEGMR